MNLDPRDSERTIKSFAWRVMRRAYAHRLKKLAFEDVEQECWVAWCKARDSYDPALGVPFNAYLRRGMIMHINRWVESFEREGQMMVMSLNQFVNEEGDELGASIAAPEPELRDPLQTDVVMRRLSEQAKMFLKLLANPPRELFEQIDRIAERTEFARSQGLAVVAAKHVTSGLIFDLMGCSRLERGHILSELKGFSSEFNQ